MAKARDGGDRLLSDDELDGYGDASINVAVLPKIGDGSATDDEFGKLPPGAKNTNKKNRKKKTKNPAAKKQPIKADANASIPVNGLAGRMNGM